jgi:hypothetical protein
LNRIESSASTCPVVPFLLVLTPLIHQNKSFGFAANHPSTADVASSVLENFLPKGPNQINRPGVSELQSEDLPTVGV